VVTQELVDIKRRFCNKSRISQPRISKQIKSRK
jgi:hypothetical protein